MSQYTVVDLDEAAMFIVEWNGGRGGPPVRVPLDAADIGHEIAVGDVLDLDDEYLSEGMAVGTRLGNATLVALQAGRKAWVADPQGAAVTIPFASVGYNAENSTALAGASFWLYLAGPELPASGHFQDAEAFLAAWRGLEAARRARSRAEQEMRQLAREMLTEIQPGGFVNPYNFVPLPDAAPERGAPCGHLGLAAGRLSGRIAVTFEALTPLAVSGAGRGTQDDPFTPIEVDGDPVLPGSSVAGLVRNFHEALTGSCLRVSDADFVPIHRDQAAVRGDRWRMALVTADGQGNPKVRLCDLISGQGGRYAAVWVEASAFPRARMFDSAQRYDWNPAEATLTVPDKRFRLEHLAGPVPELADVADDSPGRWLTIVSAIASRRPRFGEHPYHLPFGRLGEATLPLRPEVLQAYQAAAHDANDPVRRRRGETPNLTVAGVGTRQEVREVLQPGDVLWVRLDATGQQVEQVSRAAIWRSPGRFPVGARIGAYQPCTDPGQLCPSCAVFGMAEERDPSVQAGGRARQDSYRGHVRFEHAQLTHPDGTVLQDAVTRMRPLGQPRPGAGQFYLTTPDSVFTEHHGRAVDPTRVAGARPLREWGSEADTGFGAAAIAAGQPSTLRPIRGRKRYWSVDSDGRHRAQPGDNDNMVTHQRLVKKGARLAVRVAFDNLTRAQLGALLVSLVPQLLAPHLGLGEAGQAARFVHKVGKGKGVALGAVHAPDLELTVYDVSDYADPAPTDRQVEPPANYVADFLSATPVQVLTTWPALMAMALHGRVPSHRLTYPPDDHPGAEFKFDFWKYSTGSNVTATRKGADGRPISLTVLPDAAGADPRVLRPWVEG